MHKNFRISLGIILVAVVLAACSSPMAAGPTPTPRPCTVTEVKEFLNTLLETVQRFDDTAEAAKNTALSGLAPAIAEMEAARQETQQSQVPACTEPAKAALLLSMDTRIEGYRQILAGEPGEKSAATLKLADDQTTAFNTVLANLLNQATK